MVRLSAYGRELQRQREQEMIARHEDAVVRRMAQQYAELRDYWLEQTAHSIWLSMLYGGRPDTQHDHPYR